MGKTFDAAVMTVGQTGVGLGAVPTAMANMRVIDATYGSSPTAFFIVPLVRALPLSATLWLIAGGALYTAGAIIFGLERPRFKLSWFGSHELFHLFVIGGSVCHYITVARCLA